MISDIRLIFSEILLFILQPSHLLYNKCIRIDVCFICLVYKWQRDLIEIERTVENGNTKAMQNRTEKLAKDCMFLKLV